MCQAFDAAGAETTLVVPREEGDEGDRYGLIASTYGLSPTPAFRVRTLRMMNLPGRELMFGAAAVLGDGWRKETVIYTRSVSVGAAAAALRRPIVLEMHLPLSAYRPLVARRLRRLVHMRASACWW